MATEQEDQAEVDAAASLAGSLAPWLARLALALPLLVLLAIGGHVLWFAATDPLAGQRALGVTAALGQLTLTPAGRPPRGGPGSHAAVDGRHAPSLPQDRASSGELVGGGR